MLADGTVTANEGLIPGTECLTYADDGSGRKNVTLMVQVPAPFDPSHPCIVTGPSPGSRGIYGAIATSGEWGLKNGCAVAYTDKGTGVGAHDLQDDTVSLIDGHARAPLSPARLPTSPPASATASAPPSTPKRPIGSPSSTPIPSRIRKPRGASTSCTRSCSPSSNSIGIIRRRPSPRPIPSSSVPASRTGSAPRCARRKSTTSTIDGIAVSEPNVHPPPGEPFTIVQGDRPPFLGGRPLNDYPTQLAIFQGRANLSQPEARSTLCPRSSAPSCASLRAKNLLTPETLAEQAAEAQAIINRDGFLVEQNVVQPSHRTSFVPQAVAVTYANAYARARVKDNLCGYSFGATDSAGTPIPLSHTAEALLFGTASGIPPTAGIDVINNAWVGGPRLDTLSVSPSTGTLDQNLDGALSLRSLWLGFDTVTGAPLTAKLLRAHKRLRRSIDRNSPGVSKNWAFLRRTTYSLKAEFR